MGHPAKTKQEAKQNIKKLVFLALNKRINDLRINYQDTLAYEKSPFFLKKTLEQDILIEGYTQEIERQFQVFKRVFEESVIRHTDCSVDDQELLRHLSRVRVTLKERLADTVCSFSNREGGHIILGVNDDGIVSGIAHSAVNRIKSEFVTTINNPSKMHLPLYLVPEVIDIGGKSILHMYVPVGMQVCRVSGRVMDRVEDSDIDITNNSDAVYQLYARKQCSYYVNKVTGFGIDILR